MKIELEGNKMDLNQITTKHMSIFKIVKVSFSVYKKIFKRLLILSLLVATPLNIISFLAAQEKFNVAKKTEFFTVVHE